jgi:hypothetical protein
LTAARKSFPTKENDVAASAVLKLVRCVVVNIVLDNCPFGNQQLHISIAPIYYSAHISIVIFHAYQSVVETMSLLFDGP